MEIVLKAERTQFLKNNLEQFEGGMGVDVLHSAAKKTVVSDLYLKPTQDVYIHGTKRRDNRWTNDTNFKPVSNHR